MEIIILDGKRMTTIDETHRYISEALRFPEYYGANLDALADCLSERGGRTVVIFTNTGALRDALGKYADRLLSVFRDAASGSSSLRLVEY